MVLEDNICNLQVEMKKLQKILDMLLEENKDIDDQRFYKHLTYLRINLEYAQKNLQDARKSLEEYND